MKKIVLATHNKGKVAEFKELFSSQPYEIISLDELNVNDVEETGLTFIENALIKARHTSKITGLSAIADDSGLSVNALQGAPGIYSARYAGEPSNDQLNNLKLLEALKDVPDNQRQAYFYCALVFLSHAEDPTPIIALGKWDGIILKEPKGDGGFGYDPLFYIPELGCSAAELSRQEKSRYSHRGLALQKLLQQFK